MVVSGFYDIGMPANGTYYWNGRQYVLTAGIILKWSVAQSKWYINCTPCARIFWGPATINDPQGVYSNPYPDSGTAVYCGLSP